MRRRGGEKDAAQTLAVRVRGLELACDEPRHDPEHREAGRRRDAVPKRPQVRAREPWHFLQGVRRELAAQLAGEALAPEYSHVESDF